MERRIGCRPWQPIDHFALLITRFRAGDGVRTHDIQLGKLALYQLSYARVRTNLAPHDHTEPAVGIEPTTARLRIGCSTTELLWRETNRRTLHALARIRTETPCGTTPSRWRVYQFHHQGAALLQLSRTPVHASARPTSSSCIVRPASCVLHRASCIVRPASCGSCEPDPASGKRERRGSNPRPLE